jgi:DNA helicase TIP49 (TBP-interacting protein)
MGKNARNDDNDQPRFHGIPADLLDRLLIVPTKGYNQEETAAVYFIIFMILILTII